MATEEEWDPDKALASLTEETTLIDRGDSAETARRLLQHSLPAATASVIHIALHSHNERLRLEASKTILDRCLGTVASTDPLGRPLDPLEKVLTEIFTSAQEEAP
jgi:hypothetical protein